MSHKKYSDIVMALAIANVPEGASRAAFVAKIAGCTLKTAQLYIMRTERPEEYQRWFSQRQRYMYKYRGTDRMTKHRKPPVVPEPAAIETALRLSEGNVSQAGRILGCSKTPVRNYVVTERAKGRLIGNKRGHIVEIEVPVDSPKAKKANRDPKGDPVAEEHLRQLLLDLLAA